MTLGLVGVRDTVKRPVCVTPWSFIHFLWGVAFTQSLGLSKTTGLLVHTVYEMNDIVNSYNEKLNVRTNNSVINSLFDTIFFMIGQRVTMKIPSSFMVALITWGLFEIIAGEKIG